MKNANFRRGGNGSVANRDPAAGWVSFRLTAMSPDVQALYDEVIEARRVMAEKSANLAALLTKRHRSAKRITAKETVITTFLKGPGTFRYVSVDEQTSGKDLLEI